MRRKKCVGSLSPGCPPAPSPVWRVPRCSRLGWGGGRSDSWTESCPLRCGEAGLCPGGSRAHDYHFCSEQDSSLK